MLLLLIEELFSDWAGTGGEQGCVVSVEVEDDIVGVQVREEQGETAVVTCMREYAASSCS